MSTARLCKQNLNTTAHGCLILLLPWAFIYYNTGFKNIVIWKFPTVQIKRGSNIVTAD